MENRAALSFSVDMPGGVDRLRDLILYVCKRCEQAPRFGKVKLNKILWRADFEAYRARRVPVTGRPYEKLAAGPAPAEVVSVIADLVRTHQISFTNHDYGDDYIEERPKALVIPNLSLFNAGDIFYTDQSIKYYWNKSATDASLLSHKVAWQGVEFKERIAYESVFLSDRKLNSAERTRFSKMAIDRGWKSL